MIGLKEAIYNINLLQEAADVLTGNLFLQVHNGHFVDHDTIGQGLWQDRTVERVKRLHLHVHTTVYAPTSIPIM